VNPQRIKGLNGYKTDPKDAQWIAGLLEGDKLKGSLVPRREIRELRREITPLDVVAQDSYSDNQDFATTALRSNGGLHAAKRSPDLLGYESLSEQTSLCAEIWCFPYRDLLLPFLRLPVVRPGIQ
jgi:hypothetical protein